MTDGGRLGRNGSRRLERRLESRKMLTDRDEAVDIKDGEDENG